MNRDFLLVILILCLFCVTEAFAQAQPKELTAAYSVSENYDSLLPPNPIECNCLIDSITEYKEYSIALLHVQNINSHIRLTVIGQYPQFGTIDVTKIVGQTYKFHLHKVYPYKGEANPRIITYVAVASTENGPLYLNANEQPQGELYLLQQIEGVTREDAFSFDFNNIKYYSLEDMYYTAVNSFLTIGKRHHFISENIPQYISSEHFYSPFRMCEAKRPLPDGIEFCDANSLKKKITRKHPCIAYWYFGADIADDIITIWAWTPYCFKKKARLQESFCTYYWIVYQYKNGGWVLLNTNVSQI